MSKVNDLFREIMYCNERLQQLGSDAVQALDQLKTIHPDADHGDLECMKEYAIKAVKCGEHRIGDKRGPRRCNWWNRGYCREATSCPYRHQAEDYRQHIEGSCRVQGCSLRHRRRCKYWASAVTEETSVSTFT